MALNLEHELTKATYKGKPVNVFLLSFAANNPCVGMLSAVEADHLVLNDATNQPLVIPYSAIAYVRPQ